MFLLNFTLMLPCIVIDFSTVQSALASFMQVFDDRFQTESILTLLGNGQQKPA